jgi:hypothetical protein
MSDTKVSQTNAPEPPRSDESPTRSVGGSLAAMFLVESVREGNVVEVPSLGITLRKRDPKAGEPQQTNGKH